MGNNFDRDKIIENAKSLVKEHGKNAVDIVQNRIDNLPNQCSRESDSVFLLLNEVEKLVENS
jgi:hypothetical protein